eukprot:TRINITY_DN1051_c0_g1_i1.p1 TRINITY_DN1051_c0_g1~~TRINITY_DN1051_c0_g1_i1.p1  ORF type:complete len:321 (+),score=92.89 TRINITY_DN1051_c0_g1_i1:141-965(+)
MEARVEKGKAKSANANAKKKLDRNIAMVIGDDREQPELRNSVGLRPATDNGSRPPAAVAPPPSNSSKPKASKVQAADAERHLMANAAEARMKRKTANDIGKVKRERNLQILFGDTENLSASGQEAARAESERKEASLFDRLQAESHVEVDHEHREKVEKALALLFENDDETIVKTLKLTEALCKNIIKNGDTDDHKYTQLKLTNQKVQDEIVAVPGALELLLAIGFYPIEVTNELKVDESVLYYDLSESPMQNLELAKSMMSDLRQRMSQPVSS